MKVIVASYGILSSSIYLWSRAIIQGMPRHPFLFQWPIEGDYSNLFDGEILDIDSTVTKLHWNTCIYICIYSLLFGFIHQPFIERKAVFIRISFFIFKCYSKSIHVKCNESSVLFVWYWNNKDNLLLTKLFSWPISECSTNYYKCQWYKTWASTSERLNKPSK